MELPSPVASLIPRSRAQGSGDVWGLWFDSQRSRLEEYPFCATRAAGCSPGGVVMARKRKQGGKASSATMPVMRPDAAGIDIGATEIFVAVPADRAAENVRSFPTFTQDLYSLADWLTRCGIKTVAMESTGVYWIPLFQILEERGFEVCLVNARHVKNVPGRRTD